MAPMKLVTVDQEVGVILPQAVLDRFHIHEGDLLQVLETPRGIELTPYDPELAHQVEVAEQVMRENRDVLRRLAQ